MDDWTLDDEEIAQIELERWYDRLERDPGTVPGYSPRQDPPEHWDGPAPAVTPAPAVG